MVIELKATFPEFEPVAAKDYDKAISGFIQAWLDMVLKFALDNLRKNDNWVTGTLARSGRVEFDQFQLEGELIFSAPYAAYVEFGTRPHVAPLGPSLTFVEGRRGRIRITRTPSPSTNPLDYWAWRRGHKEGVRTKKYGVHTKLGFAVWKKIIARGTDPHPYLRPAIDQSRKHIRRLATMHGLEFQLE